VVKKAQKRFNIHLYEMAIVSNHIHVLVKGNSRHDLQNFFRVVAGHIAQEILHKLPISEDERRDQLAKQAARKRERGGTPENRELSAVQIPKMRET
jgi:REP element-mobilizing transposase RayT